MMSVVLNDEAEWDGSTIGNVTEIQINVDNDVPTEMQFNSDDDVPVIERVTRRRSKQSTHEKHDLLNSNENTPMYSQNKNKSNTIDTTDTTAVLIGDRLFRKTGAREAKSRYPTNTTLYKGDDDEVDDDGEDDDDEEDDDADDEDDDEEDNDEEDDDDVALGDQYEDDDKFVENDNKGGKGGKGGKGDAKSIEFNKGGKGDAKSKEFNVTSDHIKEFEERLAINDPIFVTMRVCQDFDTRDAENKVRGARKILKEQSERRKRMRDAMKKKFTTKEEYDKYKPYIMLSFMASYKDFDIWKDIKTDTTTGFQRRADIKANHFKGNNKAYQSFLRRFQQKPLRQFEALRRILYPAKEETTEKKGNEESGKGNSVSVKAKEKAGKSATSQDNKKRKRDSAGGEGSTCTEKPVVNSTDDEMPGPLIKLLEADRGRFRLANELSVQPSQGSQDTLHETNRKSG